MKVAIVYDRVNKWGGAERLLLSLKKIFPQAHLFTSVFNKNNASWALHNFGEVRTSFLQKFPMAPSFHQAYASFMPLAFESFDFGTYDLVISVTSEGAKGIITKPETKHLCVCLTPTRYLWSGYENYFRNPILKFFSKPIVSYLRTWDKTAAARPDAYISISNEVRKRIKKYYERESKVIYPPPTLVQSSDFKVQTKPRGKYFLIVSRLVPYKRVDIAIRACNKLKLPLKIVGKGSQGWFLKMIAGSNVEFLGEVSDEKLRQLYQNCRSLIFPGVEDFGLVMAEAQSMGSPVIAFRGGGALEIVKEGQTGEFFDSQTPDSLAKVLEKWDDKRYNRSLCIENSLRFSFENFRRELTNFVGKNL